MKKIDNISETVTLKDNIEVYTLTCTWAASYGAVLQAYALSKKINDLGWRAKIINYQPNYYGVGSMARILAPLYRLKRYIFDQLYLDFLRESGMITGGTYNNIGDLKRSNLSASAFIVGSDQVWNCIKYYNGKDDAMFLDFIKPSEKRVSYAASLAMPEVPGDQADRYKKMLSKFHAISVREKTGAEALAKIGIKKTEVVIDPVYLLDQKDWSELARKSIKDFSKEKYVLIICLEERDNIYEYARKKADMLGVKLYSLQGGVKVFKKHEDVDKSFKDISVYDYLNIVENAEAVIADSFHAMSFSLIFNRDVDIIPRDDKGNSRMVDLLSDLKIAERITTSDRVLTEKIDFTIVNQRIAEKVAHATEFLKDSIGGYNHG